MNILEKVVKSLTKTQLVEVVLNLSTDDTVTFECIKHVIEEQAHEETLQRKQSETPQDVRADCGSD